MTDVDDEQLGALFRAAASDSGAPPPGFDHDGIVRASRRATVRRRAAVTGAGLALFAVVGIGGAVVLPGSSDGDGDATSVAAPMFAPAPEDSRVQPDAAPPGDPRAQRQAPPPAAAEGAPRVAPAPEAAAGARRLWARAPPSAPTGRTLRCARWWSRCCPRWSGRRRPPSRWSAGPAANAG